jgi:hypothetical protein
VTGALTDQIVDLAVIGDRTGLRKLLAGEAAQYQRFSTFSPLVRDIEAAEQQLRDTIWDGLPDDDPRVVLSESCPHPVEDGFGYCYCCGADLKDYGDER